MSIGSSSNPIDSIFSSGSIKLGALGDLSIGRDSEGVGIVGDNQGNPAPLLQTYNVVQGTGIAAIPQDILATQSNSYYLNQANSGGTYLNLPPASGGISVSFAVTSASGIRITAAAGDTILINGAETSVAGYVESTQAGSVVSLLAISDTQWCDIAVRGRWEAYNGTASVPVTSLECGYWFSSPAATANGVNDIVKAAGTTTAFDGARGFTHSGTNRLTYDGGATKKFRVTASVSMTKASGGSALGALAIAKNGTPITGAIIDRTLANTSDEGAMAITATLELATDDYLELFCRTDNGDDITIETGTVIVTAISSN